MAHITKREYRRRDPAATGGWVKTGRIGWQARYPNPADPTKEIVRTFPVKKAAEAWLLEQRITVHRGTHIDPRRANRPFGAVLAEWQDSWVDLAPSTIKRNRQVIRAHLQPAFGRTPIGAIDHTAVQNFINGLTRARQPNGKPYSPGTVAKVHRTLYAAMAYAVRNGLIAGNPCADAKLPKLVEREALFLNHAEVQALAAEIDPHWRRYVLTAAYCGLRAGELAALRHRDVDLDRGRLHVRRGLKAIEPGGVPDFRAPKNGKTRVVTMPPSLTAEVRRQMVGSGSGSDDPDALVFTAPGGGVIRQNTFLKRTFRPAVRRALPPDKDGLTFHDLRHSAASLLIAQGASAKQVMERLGHKSVDITNRYTHLYEDHDAALMIAMDAAIAEASGSNVIPLRPAAHAG